jgi:uncharacterized protein YutD
MNESVEEVASIPLAIQASFQEHSLSSEHDEVDRYGSRFANIFTRYKGFVKWHDEVIVRGIRMQIERVLDHFDNVTGDYVHTELRGLYLGENNSLHTVNDDNR